MPATGLSDDPCAENFMAVQAAMTTLNEIYKIPYADRDLDAAQQALDELNARGRELADCWNRERQ